MSGGLSKRNIPLTFGVNQSPDSLIALAAAANKGGVSSTSPVFPKSKINMINPETKTINDVINLFLELRRIIDYINLLIFVDYFIKPVHNLVSKYIR